MSKIGFTTSIPVECVFAAGITPVDLNNIFITASNPEKYIEKAEYTGFPRSTCAWIKGIYSAVLAENDIEKVIGVIEGDCSNTRALIEVLELKGIESVPFAYPNSRDYILLQTQIEQLCGILGTDLAKSQKIKIELDAIRQKLVRLDELTWKENKATGFENHLWQVSSSDFNGHYHQFTKDLDKKLKEIENRPAMPQRVRLGYIGVPPINTDLYDVVESMGARVVFNEVQRQFTMAHGIGMEDLVEVYRTFTYPYSLSGRLEDIKEQIKVRQLDGIIHYTQAFCFRGIEDIVIRESVGIPVLTLEGDKPGALDARTRLRLEAFIDMLKAGDGQ